MNSDTVVLFFFREGVHFLTYEKKAQGVVKKVLGVQLGGGGVTSTQVYLYCYVGYYLTTLGTQSSCIAQSSP